MIGFFGGSFDPVHYGHLKTARAIKKELKLKQLFLIPCKTPVHKTNLQFSNKQRLEMLNLALVEFDDLQVDTQEIDRQNASYTIDTLKQINKDYLNEEIFLIMGEDSFNTLEAWKNYQQFGNYAQLVVLPRLPLVKGSASYKKVYFAKTPLVDISSTQIRSKIRNQQDLSGLLPENIIKYIKKL
ncbi:Nicotinate-nucleotide adenylyltransferase [Bathymodiolus heckerae thiotrophic gill symbiont]|uniref:nicotinate (nicotinamide) nucleotide adenylyltransferase n=1 Tax=Bathymodiolus heckerae thiotrophic gill symbiont TaxID=1052212 RepID=UPI0010B6FCF2|nr:nicotinate (nicotinamide) nucleotide adenylyltransferase [Bathymodiolus heckerae thiotrophic gill symbiont]CAC9435562.1 Nicotinate-nucleotide adenylyltransferase (EC 2.7.7.18) [uncultured Gammaproteobacteria bacterium]SMN13015.1 Nicotinate-nucleotide adenylyltransferase [Bathymodiolus heckerae thiotrophic gill symbiont]